MKLTKYEGFCGRKRSQWCWIALAALIALSAGAIAQGVSTTTVQGTVYLANGQPGAGTLVVSWPAFTTAVGQVIAADSTTLTIRADGLVSVSLAPNQGATPAGEYYTAVYYMSDGSISTQYWVVPAGAQATLAQVQAQLMPAVQAVQTVSKAYVDQSIAEATQSVLSPSGGDLTGPLYLSGDPTQPMQAADKHYVDTQVATALPLTGGTLSGPVTATQIGAVYQADQFPGVDFGAKLQACVNGVNASSGGTCDARNFSGSQTLSSNLTLSTPNTTVLLPCVTIATANQIAVTAGTRNVALRGCALRGGSAASGSQGGTVLAYSGSGAMIKVGDPTYATDTPGFHLDNVVINTTGASSASAQGLAVYRTQELDIESVYFLGNANQTGMTLDGTGNYTGGTFFDDQFDGFQTAVNAVGHQVVNPATTDWVNASVFVRLHIDCPTSNGNPIAGTYGINFQQGDGNTFTGGDVEGCSTALHLGVNAQNNTIVGLRNENSTNQVVADAGSSYNSWITGGTIFTGQLTDNGTRNSFLDTFHRSFNGLNGDWYGSQQDATLTNHYRLGIGSGNERGLLNRYQTDYGYRWTMGLSDATAGEQFYQVLDELNNVNRISIGQYNNGQSSTNNQTAINSAGAGAVVLNGSSNAGTGGVVFGSGGPTENTVATISNAGNAQFNGTLLVGGTAQSTGTMTVRNNADSEVDYYLWPGLTASQKGSFTYKDWNGNSQWYMMKDASNNWTLNSAIGGLDSFKAYQSTNSGDTYVNAANSTGVVRVNYETGSGTGFKVYGGGSGTVYASFTGATSIEFPGLAAGSGYNCLQVDSSGYVTNTGSACGSGSGATLTSGSAGQYAKLTSSSAMQGVSPATVLSDIGGASQSSLNTETTRAESAESAAQATANAALPANGVATSAGAHLTGNINGDVQITASPYLAKCDGVTNDYTAIQSAYYAAGSNNFSTIPTETYFGMLVNKPQGTVDFPGGGKTCLTGSPIIVPPGVSTKGNFAHLAAYSGFTGDLLQESFFNIVGSGTFYAYAFSDLENLYLDGPGSSVSTGACFDGQLSSFAVFKNVVADGCKYGHEGIEEQYDLFEHFHSTANAVGKYFTSLAANSPTYNLDDTFIDEMDDHNTAYGFWGQGLGSSRMERADISSNGHANIVMGEQLPVYISSVTFTGGSGCTVSANLPLTFSDSTGIQFQGYLQTNSSGAPVAVWVVDGGQGFTAPTITLMGSPCTTAPTFTAALTNDTGLGIWSGTASAYEAGKITFDSVKTEEAIGINPTSGYSVVLGPNIRNLTFNDFDFEPEIGGSGSAPVGYGRLARIADGGNTFNNPGDPTNTFDSVSNPAVTSFTDVSVFRAAAISDLKTTWGPWAFSSTSNVGNYVIGPSGAVVVNQPTDGFDASGYHVSAGYSNFNGVLIPYTWTGNTGSGSVVGSVSPTIHIPTLLQPVVAINQNTYPNQLIFADSTNSGATNGIPSGYQCVLNQIASGVGADYTQSAICVEAGTNTTEFYISVGTALASPDFVKQASMDSSGGFYNANGIVLPSALSGYHGTSGTKVQLSDGTGTSGHIASFASDGSVTDSGGSLASPGAITPTTVTATGIITGANDTTRTTTTTMTNSWTTTGLVLPPVPVSTTKSGRCIVYWQMSSTSYTATFGLGMNNAPAGSGGGTSITYASTGTSNWYPWTDSATTTTAISSATTAGATNTTYRAEIDFSIQTGAANPVTMTIYGETSNAGGTLTIEPWSTCYWLP